MLHIGPDNSPQDFISIPTKTDVTFNWRCPTIPNGIIIQYRLIIEVNIGANTFRATTQLIDVNPNQNTVSITVGGFSPYQNYTATVSATTVVGYGPIATTEGRTDPDSKYVSYTFSLSLHLSSIL